MNTRQRQKIRAILKLRTVQPIMATLPVDNGWHLKVVFIDPRDWDEAKEKFGDSLQAIFAEGVC